MYVFINVDCVSLLVLKISTLQNITEWLSFANVIKRQEQIRFNVINSQQLYSNCDQKWQRINLPSSSTANNNI